MTGFLSLFELVEPQKNSYHRLNHSFLPQFLFLFFDLMNIQNVRILPSVGGFQYFQTFFHIFFVLALKQWPCVIMTFYILKLYNFGVSASNILYSVIKTCVSPPIHLLEIMQSCLGLKYAEHTCASRKILIWNDEGVFRGTQCE